MTVTLRDAISVVFWQEWFYTTTHCSHCNIGGRGSASAESLPDSFDFWESVCILQYSKYPVCSVPQSLSNLSRIDFEIKNLV